jgi:hypothetical protein
VDAGGSGCAIIGEADCDLSVCPYQDQCKPYPFTCCNHTSGTCYEWDGQGGADVCADADRHTGWNAGRECSQECSQSAVGL